ncbi:MAG: hypothetical protein U0359_39785 [Byssovorax sp.]
MAETQAEVDALRRPSGHDRIGRDDEDDSAAALTRAHDRDVHGPGVLFVEILVALDLENDGQHDRPLLISKLEHEVSAELHGDELIERGFDDLGGGVSRHVDVEDGREEVGRELRVIAEHLDEGVVLERRHDWTLP